MPGVSRTIWGGAMSDRWDWEFAAECPNNGEPAPRVNDPDNEHLTIDADATNSAFRAREAITIETCGVCGAELDIAVSERPTEVLE